MMQIISLPFHFSLLPALLPKGSLFESLILLDFPVAKPLTSRAVCLKGTAHTLGGAYDADFGYWKKLFEIVFILIYFLYLKMFLSE